MPLNYPLEGFRTDPAFERELQATPEYKNALRDRAEVAAEFAREFSPVLTGAYRGSIHVRMGPDGPELVASDYKAFWIEFGTGEPGPTPAFAPLRRGLLAAGIELGEG